MSSTFYPHLYVGCEVLVANQPDASESQWRLGKVTVLKNESCDIIVATMHGYEYRHDVYHVDDPRCIETREWSDPLRGVFKLSEREKTLQSFFQEHARVRLLQEFIDERLPKLEKKLEVLEQMLERQVRK